MKLFIDNVPNLVCPGDYCLPFTIHVLLKVGIGNEPRSCGKDRIGDRRQEIVLARN
jgi:hypothetical protein